MSWYSGALIDVVAAAEIHTPILRKAGANRKMDIVARITILLVQAPGLQAIVKTGNLSDGAESASRYSLHLKINVTLYFLRRLCILLK